MWQSINSEFTFKTLKEYFALLEGIGYVKPKTSIHILALTLVEDFINSDFSYFVSDEDLSIINRFIRCLHGKECLIKTPVYTKDIIQAGSILPNTKASARFDFTENSFNNATEDGFFSILENWT